MERLFLTPTPPPVVGMICLHVDGKHSLRRFALWRPAVGELTIDGGGFASAQDVIAQVPAAQRKLYTSGSPFWLSSEVCF
jgi:hypothetical protein